MERHIPSYPKVYNLGHLAIRGLFDEDVVAQEKVDGSQFSFAKLGGELVMRSKGQSIYSNSTDGLFKPAVDAVLARFDSLTEGYIYRGEVLAKPKHNTLAYDRVPKDNIILFDVHEADDSWYASQTELVAEAARLDLEAVPCYNLDRVGPGFEHWSMAALEAVLQTPSILGGTNIEGAVFKDHTRFGKDGKFLAGKHVSEVFKETHKKSWKEGNPTRKDVVELIKAEMRSEARFNKARHHLLERGELTGTPKDIGALLNEAKRDIEEEEKEYISERLFKHFIGDILRGATAGLPEWYKRELAKEQFDEDARAEVRNTIDRFEAERDEKDVAYD